MVPKPDDETLELPPGVARATDSFIGAPATDPGRAGAAPTGVAPEASQGPWRERAFTPRGVMAPGDIISGLAGALRVALAQANHPRVAFDQVRAAWLPLLRQAVEQVGGDGLDAWLLRLLKPPGRAAADAPFDEVVAALGRMRLARDLAQLEEQGLGAVELVRALLGAERPRRLSFKQLERELEGKVEVDELLAIACSSDEELARRVDEIGATMAQLRDQLRTMPGSQPEGMYANFVRLKAELRVVGGELALRGRPGAPGPG